MKNVLRIVAGLLDSFFFKRTSVDHQPSKRCRASWHALLEGVGLSTQIGDLGSFFITVGAMTLIGAITTTRHWFYAPSCFC